jgi:hypothetical protein
LFWVLLGIINVENLYIAIHYIDVEKLHVFNAWHIF